MGKVAIVGVEGSGKTVLMGALCECYKQGAEDEPYLMPENQAAFMFMERIPHKLRVEREWPEATSVSSLKSMRWTLRLGAEVLEEIEMLDYPGELYRIAFGERTKEEADSHRAELSEFLEHLTSADTLIVLLNLGDVRNLGANPRNAETVWITRGIFDFAKKLTGLKHKALVFTQADRFQATLEAAGGAEGVYANRLPMLKTLYPDLKVIAVSAVSGMDGDNRPKLGYSAKGCLEVMKEILWVDDARVKENLEACKEVLNQIKSFKNGSDTDFVRLLDRYCTAIRAAKNVTKSLMQCYGAVVRTHDEQWISVYSHLRACIGECTTNLTVCQKAKLNAWTIVLERFDGCERVVAAFRDYYDAEKRKADDFAVKKNRAWYKAKIICIVSVMSVLLTVWACINDRSEKYKLALKRSQIALKCGNWIEALAGANEAMVHKTNDTSAKRIEAIARFELAANEANRTQKYESVYPLANVVLSVVADYPRAQWVIGKCYWKGVGVAKDEAEAVKWYRKAAEQGVADAQYRLGLALSAGRGVANDENEAAKWYRKAAEQNRHDAEDGDAVAQFGFGMALYFGHGVAKDGTEAMKWWRKAAEQGIVRAQYRLGLALATGNGGTKSEAEAAMWYRKAAEQGYADAQVNLGLALASGDGVVKNEAEAAMWYRKAAEQGDADAQYMLGRALSFGKGIEKDGAAAAKWYRKAAEQGNADAQFSLGWALASGDGVVKREAEAAMWYRKAAEQGNADAQFGLGLALASGNGVVKSEAEAAMWYRKAAEQGSAGAQLMLGVVLTRGDGVTKSEAEAAMWYRKAAEQGYAYAQYVLGVALSFGKGIEKDGAAAARWYRKAAEQGHAGAQYMLGYVLATGNDVVKDEAEAVKWYHKAVEQDHVGALFNLSLCYAKGEGVEADEAKALEYWRRAEGKDDPEILYFMGMALASGDGVQQNRNEAVRLLRKAAALGSELAKKELDRLGY